MTPLGPLHHVHVHGITDDMDAELLAGAARQLLLGVAVHKDNRAQVHPRAVAESLALVRAITDRLDTLLIHRYLTDEDFCALVADGRFIELDRRVWADVDAFALELADLSHEVQLRKQAHAIGLAS